MQLPSKSLVFTGIFLAYILQSIYSIVSLFIPPTCSDAHCLNNYLASKPNLQLILATTDTHHLASFSQLQLIDIWSPLHYNDLTKKKIEIILPKSTQNNGSIYLWAFVTEVPRRKNEDWKQSIQQQSSMSATTKLSLHLVPEAKAFNLLSDADDSNGNQEKKSYKKSDKTEEPVTHLTKQIRLVILSELIKFPKKDLPDDIKFLIRLVRSDTYLPPLRFDHFSSRLKDFYKLNQSQSSFELELEFSPESIGKLRLGAQIEGAMESMKTFGFSSKDLDEVKAIFSDTNVYLLALTMFVASVHLLFDFLAFKNDIGYWKNRKTTVGLSIRTILWRCFSQFVIFLYLFEEKSSLLILIPSGIGVLIEIWKVSKAFKITVQLSGLIPKISMGSFSESEKATAAHDGESMKYLSYILYPLLSAGALYSLLYTPHKSWYQWGLQTIVNGVYAFGFLFMLPQLFVNYRLKSVAHLPWRAFMYKAFNTFIDDLFAFIITMPTAHRMACFRDDIVFIIYLYQRWLYPVDKTRLDAGGDFEVDLSTDETSPKLLEVEKKNK